jgi:metal-sulfur cluster biosynthetic enzyme
MTPKPILYPLPTTAELSTYSDTIQDVYYLLSEIIDPEFPNTLPELLIIRPEKLSCDEKSLTVKFTPTVPHCSLSAFIGLAIRERLQRVFGDTRKIYVLVEAHQDAAQLNKQLADKERVLAAMENPEIWGVVEKMLRNCIGD